MKSGILIAMLFSLVALAQVGVQAKETPLQRKLRTIIVERIEMEEAPLVEVISYLRELSQKMDPDKKGVNIILMPTKDSAKTMPKVTLVLNDVPLGEVIRYICTSINYSYTVEDYAVVLAPNPPKVPSATTDRAGKK